ncbi:hypothetical protein B0H63DRAFT_439418 [Podospora didyma]|uniref:Plant heme peroxidase family profile domain-containing protein n=1 Tax=Podospora didyma TaxID=330526 RepID=A0AAE0N6A5_9PEZI|nr:hypothetical protein B0H63DRAFT_439418 [Podospora didyma]
MDAPRNYGFVKGRGISWKRPDSRCHAELIIRSENIEGSSDQRVTAAIDVMSQSRSSELVYWMDDDFTRSCLTSQLSKLRLGLYRASDDYTPALDISRGRLVKDHKGTCLDYGRKTPDMCEDADVLIFAAMHAEAVLYVFGFIGANGFIHNVHMNQGSSDFFFRGENGVSQDGGILFEFPDGHWESIFIAFTSQSLETDSSGQLVGSLLSGWFPCKLLAVNRLTWVDDAGRRLESDLKTLANKITVPFHHSNPKPVLSRPRKCQFLVEPWKGPTTLDNNIANKT